MPLRTLLTLEVRLEGDPDSGRKTSTEHQSGSPTNKEAGFTEFQVVRIPSVDSSGEAAVGWIAHSSYPGAILKRAASAWYPG